MKDREKSGNFMLSQGKLTRFNTADLIPFRAGRNISGHCDLKDVFLNEEGKK